MDTLSKTFEKLDISSPKTGLVFNDQMLLHSPFPKKHFENPQRIEAILSHLSAKSFLNHPNIEIVQHLNPALDSSILACHPTNYVEYVEEMFPAECEKKSIFIFDSYYNKYTNLAARIAVSALTLCVDKVLKKEWKNAYALVRPPGHHSGYHSTINGFCVFNNIAIATKYAQKTYNINRVLIFDWDIHHGDGTEHIFYKDSSVLFASIHRYEDGSFYPNKGSSDRIGEGDAKGFNINVGWNTHECEEVTMNDYICIFERVLFPIFQEFKPDIIFISSGFDSCKGDPLGDIDLVPEGYAYMLRRLQSLADGKIILALEGGYNTKSLSISSEIVLRVLINEDIPLKCSDNKMNIEEMLMMANPSKVSLEACENVLNHLGTFWKSALDNQEITSLDQEMKLKYYLNFERKKKCVISGEFFLKNSSQQEKNFYDNRPSELDEFFCNYLGTKTILGTEYLKFKNLFYSKWGSLSFLEIKLGKRLTFSEIQEEGKKEKALEKADKSCSKEIGFRISNGFLVNKQQKQIKIKKGDSYSKVFTKNDVNQLLKSFFVDLMTTQEKSREVCLLFLKKIEKIKEYCDKTQKFEFLISSSLIFFIEEDSELFELKLIGLKMSENGKKDDGVYEGIQNLILFFKEMI